MQSKGGTEYLCTYLRQQYRVPVCPYVPADAVDARVGEAFFAALAPRELDVYTQAMAVQRQPDERLEAAHRQPLERLRYEATLGERQCRRVDPDNRRVTAELERRWEVALRELTTAEAAYAQRMRGTGTTQDTLSPELRAAFLAMGRPLPDLWPPEVRSHPQRNALLRCRIAKGVVRRSPRDEGQPRIVGKGGATPTLSVPATVGACTDLQGAAALEQQILTLFAAGHTDDAIAAQLTQQGYRSPQRSSVFPSTGQTIRLQHGLLQRRHQSHPRRKAGYLTLPQRATRLGVSTSGLHDRSQNGRLQIAKELAMGVYLVPAHPTTLAQFRPLQADPATCVSCTSTGQGRVRVPS